jgi:kynureninase
LAHAPDIRILKEEAENLDLHDDLAAYRDRFYRPAGMVYLDGNSLGLLSSQAEDTVLRILEDWKRLGIDGWMHAESPWFYMAEEIGAGMAGLLGAKPNEVIASNSTTVNLHQLLATLYQPSDGRTKILTDALSFPSDLYAIKSHLMLRGRSVEVDLITIAPTSELLLEEDHIIAAFSDKIAVIILPAVVYTTGQLLDIERVTRAAHEKGILIGWDCSHSIGAVPHSLDEWDVDFAFWCTYKYLNGGPGATGGLYLNRRHFGSEPGLAGWFSSAKNSQFDMSSDPQFSECAGALQIGSPNILSMAPLLGSLEIIQEARIARLREKSLKLTDYMMALAELLLKQHGFAIVTPVDNRRRGGHVALVHSEAVRICKALRAAGIVPDFRPPNIVRLAPAPLYNSFSDCLAAILQIGNIMNKRLYDQYSTGRELVA